MKSPIIMKFYVYAHKIVIDHQKQFHEDPCTNARTRVVNVVTCDKTCTDLQEILHLSSQDKN